MKLLPAAAAAATAAALLAVPAAALDNGVALTPPLGWRSFNAFWGIIDQVKMEGTMDAMTNKSRSVAGQPTSLLELGYNHIGLDGGWNYCFPENKSFHTKEGEPVWCDWAKGRPCQGNVSFPDPQAMVDKAKRLGLAPGWCAAPAPPAAAVLLPAADPLRAPLSARYLCGSPRSLRVPWLLSLSPSRFRFATQPTTWSKRSPCFPPIRCKPAKLDLSEYRPESRFACCSQVC